MTRATSELGPETWIVSIFEHPWYGHRLLLKLGSTGIVLFAESRSPLETAHAQYDLIYVMGTAYTSL